MNKNIRIIIIGVVTILLVGCVNPVINESIDIGRKYMENFKYEEAEESFKLAIQSGCTDKEIEQLLSIISDYLKCMGLIEQSKYEDAKRILSEIDISYIKYSIKKDIDKLINLIDQGVEINNYISNITNLIASKKFLEAEKEIDIVKKLNMDKYQSQLVEKISSEIKLEVDKIKKEDYELVKIEEEKNKANLLLKYRVNASEEEKSDTFLENGNGKIVLSESDYELTIPLAEGGKRIASNDTDNTYIAFSICNTGIEALINPVIKFKFNSMCIIFSEGDAWKGISRVDDSAMWTEIKWEAIKGTNITNDKPEEFTLNLANAAISGYNPTIEITVSAENFQEKTFTLPVELK